MHKNLCLRKKYEIKEEGLEPFWLSINLFLH